MLDCPKKDQVATISACLITFTTISILFSAFHLTAGSDYTAGPDRVTFSPGQSSATFMVSTEEDDTVELSEYFILMIASVDRPDVVEIGSPSTSFITIEDNEPGSLDATVCLSLVCTDY